jgi:cytochrome P450
MTLPASLPRATELREFYENPLAFLARAHADFGDIFVLREDGPLFSRASDCSGVVAIFGAKSIQAVLTDTDVFCLPVSAAEHLALPQSLINLNRGLHSMRRKQHDDHQRLLLQVFSGRSLEDTQWALNASLDAFVQSWNHNHQIALLKEMRRLTLELSGRLLFGEHYDDGERVAGLAQKYFHLRRNVTFPFNSPNETTRQELISLGSSLDQAMREYIRWCRNPGRRADGLLARLACLQMGGEFCFSEDEAVGHGNVTFMSINEPIAVALTWTLLILSQLPQLRRTLRDECERALTPESSSPLLNSVIYESLRLFTPNALMSRITSRAALLNEVPLPERCELVICPLLAHRDAGVFPRPTEFLPSRWQSIKPSPFEYFPFGAGGHACIGRSLGIKSIRAAFAFLTQRYELVLASDQEIDWQIDIIFMPAMDPIMNLLKPGTTDDNAGRLLGQTRQLIDL